MKHTFKVIGLLFTLSQITSSPSALAQALAAPNADGPRIKFSETIFDFGKIKDAEPVRHEYVVTNTGNAVLDITAVQPGCPGCTTALPWDRQVQPGQTGKIPIQFNPHGFSGPVSKSVTVSCNDPTLPSQILQFRANIWQPIDVQPTYLYFMPVEGEETNETKVVRIVSNLEEPLTLGQPQCDNPTFKLELKTLQPGKEFALHVSHSGFVSNAAPQGLITISTSSSNVPTVKVTTRVMPQPALAIAPLQIVLPPGPLTNGHHHTQMIRNNSRTLMKVTEATVNVEGVTVKINEAQPGRLFMLAVNFPANFQLPPAQAVDLTIKTTHPKRPTIKIPIAQTVTSAPPGVRPLFTPPAAAK